MAATTAASRADVVCVHPGAPGRAGSERGMITPQVSWTRGAQALAVPRALAEAKWRCCNTLLARGARGECAGVHSVAQGCVRRVGARRPGGPPTHRLGSR